MSKRAFRGWLAGGLILLLGGFYFWPAPTKPFEEIYEKVPEAERLSLQQFRTTHIPKRLVVEGLEWEYIAAGQGSETLLFLHGMTGAADIWWKQIEALRSEYRIITVSYPPASDLETLATGVRAILDKEQVARCTVIGTSLGGYLAQYLLTRFPERFARVVLSNTFPPNDEIASRTRFQGILLRLAPNWLVLKIFRDNFRNTIYPTSGQDALTLAFLSELTYGVSPKRIWWGAIGASFSHSSRLTLPCRF
jgi:pimeloyl-ACP methyl ester carboxylesterase